MCLNYLACSFEASSALAVDALITTHSHKRPTARCPTEFESQPARAQNSSAGVTLSTHTQCRWAGWRCTSPSARARRGATTHCRSG